MFLVVGEIITLTSLPDNQCVGQRATPLKQPGNDATPVRPRPAAAWPGVERQALVVLVLALVVGVLRAMAVGPVGIREQRVRQVRAQPGPFVGQGNP